MAKVNLGNYRFNTEEGYLSDMDAAKDSGDSLSANTVGEIAEVELGETGKGPFSAYGLLALGGFPDDNLRTREGRLEGDLQNGSDADVPSGTRVRIRLTDKNRERTFDKTRWFSKKEVEASNIENLPVIPFPGAKNAEWIQEGRVLVVEAKNPSTSFNMDASNSSLDFPFVGGD
jgi:hypothetical protein